MFLEQERYNTISVHSGEAALLTLEKFKPLAVILDIILPDMSGWEVLTKIKQNPLTSDLPVIICTMVDDIETGYKLGAFDYMVKPVDRTALLKKLNLIASNLPSKKKSYRVLIIDDEKVSIDLLELYFDRTEYEIIKAYGGQEGIDLFIKENPDIVILDLMMPEITGFDVLNYIRNKSEKSDTPVIVVTAKYLSEEEIEYLNQNVNVVLTKSTISKNDFLTELNKSLACFSANK